CYVQVETSGYHPIHWQMEQPQMQPMAFGNNVVYSLHNPLKPTLIYPQTISRAGVGLPTPVAMGYSGTGLERHTPTGTVGIVVQPQVTFSNMANPFDVTRIDTSQPTPFRTQNGNTFIPVQIRHMPQVKHGHFYEDGAVHATQQPMHTIRERHHGEHAKPFNKPSKKRHAEKTDAVPKIIQQNHFHVKKYAPVGSATHSEDKQHEHGFLV
ncbi:hypothetical protein RFI_13215, partial [Reticulomyxa filosa]